MISPSPHPPDDAQPWRSLRGSRRLAFSFRAAGIGLRDALRTQQNLKLHLGATLLVWGAAWMLEVTLLEGALLTCCIGLVLMAELFNTAIEKLVDLACPEVDERARFIKDVSAAAVLVSALSAVVAGALILGPRLWGWLWAQG